MKQKKERQYRYLLFAGLVLWILGIVMPIVWHSLGHSYSGQEGLMEAVKTLVDLGVSVAPMVTMTVVLLWLCVVQPVMEEFAFRFWGKDKRYAYIVSAVGMLLFAVLGLNAWLIVVTALSVLPMFLIKDSYLKKLVTIITTSVCFALMHISGFGGFSADLVFGLVNIIGMSLVMCYVVINYRFVYSIAIHVLNNSVAILVPFLFMGADVSFSGEGYYVRLRDMKIGEAKELVYTFYTEDSATGKVCYYGELPQMVEEIYRHSPKTEAETEVVRVFCPDNTSFWTKYVLECKIDSNAMSADELVAMMMKNSHLRADTSYVPALEVAVADTALYNSKFLCADTADIITFGEFVSLLGRNNALPFVLAPQADADLLFDSHASYYFNKQWTRQSLESDPLLILMSVERPKDKLLEMMREDYGLSVKESKTKKIRQVEFYVGG